MRERIQVPPGRSHRWRQLGVLDVLRKDANFLVLRILDFNRVGNRNHLLRYETHDLLYFLFWNFFSHIISPKDRVDIKCVPDGQAIELQSMLGGDPPDLKVQLYRGRQDCLVDAQYRR